MYEIAKYDCIYVTEKIFDTIKIFNPSNYITLPLTLKNDIQVNINQEDIIILNYENKYIRSYKLEDIKDMTDLEVMEAIGNKRGCKIKILKVRCFVGEWIRTHLGMYTVTDTKYCTFLHFCGRIK